MRFIRTIIVAVLAIVLLVIATANREVVALRLLPENLGSLIGRGDHALHLPLFVVVIAALVIGILLGLVWEWLREAGARRQSARRAFDLARLQRESRGHVPPSDDVLALLDQVPAQRRDARPGLPATR